VQWIEQEVRMDRGKIVKRTFESSKLEIRKEGEDED
jgi:hypothetical protein